MGDTTKEEWKDGVKPPNPGRGFGVRYVAVGRKGHGKRAQSLGFFVPRVGWGLVLYIKYGIFNWMAL